MLAEPTRPRCPKRTIRLLLVVPAPILSVIATSRQSGMQSMDSDLERLDVILTLARDMGVNLAGIEIILNMREKLIEMERQMGEFAQVVQQELSRVAASHEQKNAPRHAIVRATPRIGR
jgi:hypothetical protein